MAITFRGGKNKSPQTDLQLQTGAEEAVKSFQDTRVKLEIRHAHAGCTSGIKTLERFYKH